MGWQIKNSVFKQTSTAARTGGLLLDATAVRAGHSVASVQL